MKDFKLICTEPDVFQNHEKLMELTEETNKLKETINKLLETWETVQIEYEVYTNKTID